MHTSGIRSKVHCISGICTTTSQNKDACQDICGQPSCSDAVVTEPCDLTKQLGDFTGDDKTSLNGNFLLIYLILKQMVEYKIKNRVTPCRHGC